MRYDPERPNAPCSICGTGEKVSWYRGGPRPVCQREQCHQALARESADTALIIEPDDGHDEARTFGPEVE